MRLHFKLLTLIVFLALGARLGLAQSLPQPIFLKADPQMVYPNSPGWLDSFGRVVVYLQGENLSPDNDLGHPTGPDGGYQHLYVRGVSPKGDRVSNWAPAVWDNGATVLGACANSVIILAVDPGKYLSEPGSHLQVKLWVSEGATGAEDPSTSTARCSSWSAIKTIDVAPPGAVKPVEAPAATPTPVLTRIVPSDYTIGIPGSIYRIKIYGKHISPDALKVVFNGDVAGAVSTEDHVHYYDDDGSFTQGGEGLFHVTIPEKYRLTSPGQLRVAVQEVTSGTVTKDKLITFSRPIRTNGGIALGTLPKIQPAIVPGTNTGALNPVALPPTLTRINPAEFRIGDRAANYRIRVYGQRIGGEGVRLVFNGDEASAVPAEDRAKNVDDDGTVLQNGEVVLHVTIPEKFRKTSPGQLSVLALRGQARTNALQVEFRSLELRPMNKPATIIEPKLATPPAPPVTPRPVIRH